MPRLLRLAVLLLVVTTCAVAGFIVDWSTFGSGGLENAYRHALIGAACGLAIGIVLAFPLAPPIKPRRPS